MERGVQWRIGGALALLVSLLLVAGVARGATGDLSAPACVSGDSVTAAVCAQLPDANAGGEDSGLDELQSIDVSPGGQSVYATSQQDDAIVHFERNPTTGALTFTDCITGDTATGPAGTNACAAAPTTNANGVNTGFNNPVDAVLSNNGAWLYMASQEDDAIARFSRDTTTGTLTFVDCITGNTGVTPCTAIGTATASGGDSGLARPSGIALSPGGTTLYATASTDDGIAWFNRVNATGVIAYDDCISAETATATASCIDANDLSATGDGTGLETPFSPVVSGDGDAVYVSSNGDAAVAWFNRAGNGDLTWNDCITGDLDSGPASPAAACGTALATATAIGDGGNSGMERIQTIAVSPDDDSLYSGSQTDQAVIHFSRNVTNEDLTFEECFSGDAGLCTDVATATTLGGNSGLDFLQSLAVSPDGKNVYAAGASDAAITTFNRDLGTGDLTWDACVTGDLATVSASCAAQNATPADGVGSGLAGLYSLDVTPDGLGLVGTATADASVITAARSNAPETTIDVDPPAVSNDATPHFEFSADEPGVTFQCRVDAGAFGACSGPGSHTTAPLGDGPHTFQVRAVNDASSPDLTPASDTFTIDTAAPDTLISSGPEGLISTSDVQFEFSAPGSSALECRIDGAPFSACTSPQSYSLADGQHTFEVRGEDDAGNVDGSPASRSFEIDTVAPDTSITTSPKKTVRTDKDKKKATFRFITTEPGAFECKRDKGKDFKPCTVPYKKKYKRGKHTFTVRAVDAAGNLGVSDSHTWRMKRKK